MRAEIWINLNDLRHGFGFLKKVYAWEKRLKNKWASLKFAKENTPNELTCGKMSSLIPNQLCQINFCEFHRYNFIFTKILDKNVFSWRLFQFYTQHLHNIFPYMFINMLTKNMIIVKIIYSIPLFTDFA